MFRNIHPGTHYSLLAFSFFFKTTCQTLCKSRVGGWTSILPSSSLLFQAQDPDGKCTAGMIKQKLEKPQRRHVPHISMTTNALVRGHAQRTGVAGAAVGGWG